MDDKTIFKKMKNFFNATSLEDVAEKMGYARTTAGTWRSKGLTQTAKLKFASMQVDNKVKKPYKENNGYWITKISHNVSAGTSADIEGIEVFDKDDEKIFLPSTFFKTQMNDKYLRYFQVEGDSMFPKLRSGDWVVMKLVEYFDGDALYVINYQNILMVKALQLKPNGHLFIKSINPDYESYDLSPESQNIFKIIGKVIKSIT